MNGKDRVSSINAYRIAAATRIGYVNLRVRDLERSLTFYLDVLGLKLVVLTARKDASARPPRSTGLYHFAIRVPGRRALAMVIRRLEEMQWPVQGYADHDVSEAVYLADPDGIGIEVYADRAREDWPLRNGQVEMVTEPLELDRLMRELETWPGEWNGIDPMTDIGHVHLRVSSLEAAEEFYRGVLGFDVTQRDMAGALFLAAGGYHHHIGVNTWASEGAPRPPADAVGLISYGVFVPDRDTLHELRRRLLAVAAPLTEEEGSLRVGDPDSIFIEMSVR